MSNTITIKSGKIKSTMFLAYSFLENKPNSNDTGRMTSDLPMHEDCHQAFHNLIPHFILICEQHKKTDEILDGIGKDVDITDEESIFDKYRINEFKISGTANNEGVVLTGYRRLSTGKRISLSTPLIYWDNADYDYMDEFNEAVEALREEVLMYAMGEKHAPIATQESMQFGDEESEEQVEEGEEIAA